MNYTTGGASTGTTFMPAPLILDNKGRHIDQEGKEVKLKIEVRCDLTTFILHKLKHTR